MSFYCSHENIDVCRRPPGAFNWPRVAGRLILLWVLTSQVLTGGVNTQARRSPALTQNQAPATLETGKVIDRELKNGERHSYQINLKANEFVHIVVDQLGINVAVELSRANSAQISRIDTSRGTQGSEVVLYVADLDGTYVLTVYSPDGANLSGRYKIRIEEWRSALPQDRHRVSAYQNFVTGQQLFAEGTATSLNAAIESYKVALPFWRLVEDARAEAITLSQIAKAFDLLGEKVKALDFYNKALPVLETIQDNAGVGATLNNIGLVHDALGERQTALDYYNRALPVLRNVGEKRIEAYTLSNIGLAYDSLGEKQKALDNYKQALHMLQLVGDRRAEAAALNNIGFVYNSLGEKETALEYFGKALPIFRSVGDRRMEAITINNIGYVYESLGERQKALEHFNQSLPILRLTGERRVEAITVNNIGLVFAALGDQQKALEYFNQSLTLRRAVGDRQGEAITLSDIGFSLASSGDRAQALDYYHRALPLSKAVEDRSLEASILRRIALAARDQGNLVEAQIRAASAVEAIETVRTKIASEELRASYFASAQQYFETYIDVLMQLHNRQPGHGFDGVALQASERARARSLLDLLIEAGAGIREGVDPDLLIRERTLQQKLNAKAATYDRLMQANSSEDKLAAVKDEIKTLLSEYSEIEAQIRLNSPHYAALTQPSPLNLREIQRLLDRDTVLLEYSIAAERSYLWIVTSNSLTSVLLPGREEIEASALAVYKLLTERKRFVKFETSTERQARIRTADKEFAEQAAALSRMLLGPAVKQLKVSGTKRLLIVADGALNYVPFAALPTPEDEGAPLMVNYEIASLPSASILDVLRRETAGRKRAPKTLAVLADPVFEKEDLKRKEAYVKSRTRGPETESSHRQTEKLRGTSPETMQDPDEGFPPLRIQRLPFTRREAEEILALVPAQQRLRALDFDANRAMATNPQLGNYRFVHFATHGVLDTEHPELSGIVLSLFDRQAREQDGYLRVHEIFNLKLPVELVVLSGCRTGLGKQIKGEGLMGLTRGFMYAGAARVMVSLWDVSDEASAKLMVEFYKRMLGKERLSPAAALRGAQMALWRQERWRAPYYWAAFVLQGEPR
jgi:CHAT domain-containing protein/tetratricopeptide (TPR) repeat protein